jgi:hypothetical protein
MRLRPASLMAGAVLLALSLLAIPASAASHIAAPGEVVIYSPKGRVQTISDPDAGRCVRVVRVRGARVANQTGTPIELHRTTGCSSTPAAVAGPRDGMRLSRLRAIRARG